jgi:tRNA(Ile)-lysidine synthetase-like protein
MVFPRYSDNSQNAVFRFRQDGDKIRKFGGASKSLKKLFNEEKIPVLERATLPLVAERDGEKVFVVCGVEIADEVKIEEDTRRTLYIGVRKN